jgi:probable rRNA maturation factor
VRATGLQAKARKAKSGIRSPEPGKEASPLTVGNCQRGRRLDTSLLRHVIQNLIERLSVDKRSALGVYVVSASEMTRLNETFLGHQGSTDVLAFNYDEETGLADPTSEGPFKSTDPQPFPTLLRGEIFVCLEEACLQARRFRTTWQSELVRYIVHGFLHLCGYSDHTLNERREMKCEEDRLLQHLADQFPFERLEQPVSRMTARDHDGAPGLRGA